MSTPKNHHYVSQCQQAEFFNKEESKIYIYDKELDNHYSKPTTKSLFSEPFLNSREVSGTIDHKRLEEELKILIEDEYPKHLEIIKKFVTEVENKDEAYESLVWLSMLGVLGELRHPEYKKNLDSFSLHVQSDIISKISKFPKEVIERALQEKQKTKFSNLIGYIDTACRILERMEPFAFQIYVIESSDIFILPDTTGFHIRGQLHNYPNPMINEITQIGFPISSKLFILVSSKYLQLDASGIQYIKEDNSQMVYEINKDLFNYAYKGVAARDSKYLRKLVSTIKSGA